MKNKSPSVCYRRAFGKMRLDLMRYRAAQKRLRPPRWVGRDSNSNNKRRSGGAWSSVLERWKTKSPSGCNRRAFCCDVLGEYHHSFLPKNSCCSRFGRPGGTATTTICDGRKRLIHGANIGGSGSDNQAQWIKILSQHGLPRLRRRLLLFQKQNILRIFQAFQSWPRQQGRS